MIPLVKEVRNVEFAVLGLFCAGLVGCILLDASILYALGGGLILFLIYGRIKRVGWRELAGAALSGVKTVKNTLVTFVLIGMLTAMWRAAGTVPVQVWCAAGLIRPSVFLLMTFLLNCLVSVLTGTAFGTAATMGVICATMGMSMEMPPMLVGGAVLAGAYFGDRCSPVSTSALLVSALTGTGIFDNIKNMVRSCVVPFLAACAFYTVAGLWQSGVGTPPDLLAIFSREFSVEWICLAPAVVILTLSLLRVGVKTAMLASLLTALPIAVLVQGVELSGLPAMLLSGYRAADAQVASMLNGGGILSMVNVAAIVCLSSAYSGIFRATGLLDRIRGAIGALAGRVGSYGAVLLTAMAAGMVACNQTLTIMLTHQLCGGLHDRNEDFALDLEDSAVVIAPLVPWSIAGAVVMSATGLPLSSLPVAVYLWFLPLWRFVSEAIKKRAKVKTA